MHDEYVKKIQQEYRPIPRDQQSRQRRGQEDKHSKESTSTTVESILEPAGGSSVHSHRETCRIRSRQQIETVTIGQREVEILGTLRGLTMRDFFRV